MTRTEFADAMRKMGLHPKLNNTGDKRWTHARAYFRTGDEGFNNLGCYVCIARFHDDKLYSLKWLTHGINNLSNVSIYPVKYRIFEVTGYIIEQEEFNAMVDACKQLAQEKYEERVKARSLLAPLKNPKGKRKPLADPNPERYMSEVINMMIKVIEGV